MLKMGMLCANEMHLQAEGGVDETAKNVHAYICMCIYKLHQL